MSTLTANQVIADRYEIVRLIGVGGMGEVYEAIDRDLPRERVALKVVRAGMRPGHGERNRLVQELQLARQVTHPNVCRVHDIGRHNPASGDPTVFLTMELLEGETLADRIERDGRLSTSESLRIGRAIASGVAAAHALKIVHRDLKPANVFLCQGGRVVVTDFGIARQVRETTHTKTMPNDIAGTRLYMPPEILAGSKATEASDTYSFTLILYEMLTGRRPTLNRTELSFEGIPPSWLHVFDRGLAASPGDRFQTATDVIQALEETDRSDPEVARIRRLPRWAVAGVAALILAAASLGAWSLGNEVKPLGSSQKALSGPPIVLLGDIANHTSDPAFDWTATHLLAVAMEQSRYLNVLSRARLAELLTRTGRSGGEALSPEVALELAQAGGADFVVTGDVRRRGTVTDVLLSARATSARGRHTQLEAVVTEPAELSASIRQLGEQLRVWLGEGPAQVRTTNLPLEQVTTRSPVAWQRFTESLRMESLGRFEEEVSLLQSAVDIDSDFALAFARLGIQQNNIGNQKSGLANLERAKALQNRLIDRDRYKITGLYHSVRHEHENATQALRMLTSLYPLDDEGQRFFAQTLLNHLSLQEGVQAARRAVALNPTNAVGIATLGLGLLQTGQLDEGLELIERARLQEEANPMLTQMSAQFWMAKGEYSKAEVALDRVIRMGGTWENSGRRELAAARILEGRFRDAASQIESDLSLSPRGRDTRQLFKLRHWLSWIYHLQNERSLLRAHAQAIVDEGSAVPANINDLRGLAVTLIDSGNIDLALPVVQAIKTMNGSFESNSFRAAVSQLDGEIALRRRDFASASKAIGEALKLWPDTLTWWSAARLEETLNEPKRALNFYRQIVARQGDVLRWHFPGLIGLARLGCARMEAALGLHPDAVRDYDQVLRDWGRRSPDLKLIKASIERRQAAAAWLTPQSTEKGH